MTLISLLTLIELTPSVVLATELPASVTAAAATLKHMGYSDVAVSLRVFGGYVLQGKMAGAFVMVALSSDGKTLERTELFRDLDGNGVFGQDESLGSNVTRPVETMILTALSDPGSVAPPEGVGALQDTGAGTLDIPGFVQKSQYPSTRSSLRVEAREHLGIGAPALFETRTVTSIKTDGQQDQGLHVTQVDSVSGLRVRGTSTAVSQPEGSSVTFTQPDVAAIRASVASATPDANAIRDSIQSKVPTSESIRAGIIVTP